MNDEKMLMSEGELESQNDHHGVLSSVRKRLEDSEIRWRVSRRRNRKDYNATVGYKDRTAVTHCKCTHTVTIAIYIATPDNKRDTGAVFLMSTVPRHVCTLASELRGMRGACYRAFILSLRKLAVDSSCV